MPVEGNTYPGKNLGNEITVKAINPFIPLAGWKLDDVYFTFDKWFIISSASLSFNFFEKLYDKTCEKLKAAGINQNPKISIFGHTDPVGLMDANKIISEKRALALYGVLTKDLTIWKEIYTISNDIKYLQNNLGLPTQGISGSWDALTEDAVTIYMDKLTRLKFSKNDFLGDNGAHAYQGCSEYNLLLRLKKSEWSKMNPRQMHFANRVNRRVLAFFFNPQVDLTKSPWPCPSPKQPYIACQTKKNTYTDWETRLSDSEHKEFKNNDKLFGCKFYESMAKMLPCEKFYEPPVIYFDVETSINEPYIDEIFNQLKGFEIKNKGYYIELMDNTLKGEYDESKKKYQDLLQPLSGLSSRVEVSIYKEMINLTFEEFKEFSKYRILAYIKCRYNTTTNKYTASVYESITDELLFEAIADNTNDIKAAKIISEALYNKLKGSYNNITSRVFDTIYDKRK